MVPNGGEREIEGNKKYISHHIDYILITSFADALINLPTFLSLSRSLSLLTMCGRYGLRLFSIIQWPPIGPNPCINLPKNNTNISNTNKKNYNCPNVAIGLQF